MKKILVSILLTFFTFFCVAEKVNLINFKTEGLLTIPNKEIFIETEYNKNIFSKSSFEYNHQVARIACIFAEVSYVDTTKENNALVQNYKALGFTDENIYLHYGIDYQNEHGNDQSAFSFAYKDEVMFIVIRGTPLSANEWISNLNISDATNSESIFHEGFKVATEIVFPHFREFIKKHKINTQKTKFLITGHSRGAAIANLFSAYLSGESDFDTKNIFAYTFATPNVTISENASDAKFGYIWNIENEEDLVPFIPPERNEWKFKKFGNIRIFVNAWKIGKSNFDANVYPKVNVFFKKLVGRNYQPFYTGSFVPNQFSRILCKLEETVDDYYGFFGLRNAESIFYKFFANKSKLVEFEKSLRDENQNQNFSGQALLSFCDMHTCETYLSYLLAFNENELYSTLGSTQLVIHGSEDLIIFDKNGNEMLKAINGAVAYKTQKKPIIAYSLLNRTVVGIPLSEEYTVQFQKSCVFHTPITVRLEYYDERGILQETFPTKEYKLGFGKAYKFNAGKYLEKNETSNVNDLKIEESETLSQLKTGFSFYLSPEISFSSDKDIYFGLRIGTRYLHAVGFFAPNILKNETLYEFGLGSQINLYGRIFMDVDFLLNKKMNSSNSFETKILATLAYQPLQQFQFFGGIEFWDDYQLRFGLRF